MLVVKICGNMAQVLEAATLLTGNRTIGCLIRQREVKDANKGD